MNSYLSYIYLLYFHLGFITARYNIRCMKKLISILVLLFTITVFADVKISDYKNYTITKTNFQLEEVSKGLNYPWGMTFIDDNNLLITEKKSGRLVKINISTGEQFNIAHD